MTLGKSFNLSACFSFCDKCKSDTDSLFHRKAMGSQDSINVKVFESCCTNIRLGYFLLFQGYHYRSEADYNCLGVCRFSSSLSPTSYVSLGNLELAGQWIEEGNLLTDYTAGVFKAGEQIRSWDTWYLVFSVLLYLSCLSDSPLNKWLYGSRLVCLGEVFQLFNPVTACII